MLLFMHEFSLGQELTSDESRIWGQMRRPEENSYVQQRSQTRQPNREYYYECPHKKDSLTAAALARTGLWQKPCSLRNIP